MSVWRLIQTKYKINSQYFWYFDYYTADTILDIFLYEMTIMERILKLD